MTWFKVDDGFAFHPKALAAGNAALGLWVRSGAWCAANLTGGALPRHMIGTLGAQKRDAARLVSVGLWCETEDGYQFNSWDHYQPTKAQVEAKRKADRERQARARERDGHGGSHAVTKAVTNGGSHGAPDPTRPKKTSSSYSDADFAAFWTAYPRKAGKPAAAKAWQAAIKRGVDPQYLITTTERFAELSAATDPKFIPHPTTWLNQERYNDVDTPAASPAPRKYPPAQVPDWLDPDDVEGYAKWMREAMQ